MRQTIGAVYRQVHRSRWSQLQPAAELRTDPSTLSLSS